MPVLLVASLTFSWTPLSLVIGVALVIVTAGLCVVAWHRKGFAWGTGVLEALRLLIVTLVAVTLNQPEWLATYRPQGRPSLVVLVDASASMTTCDVIDPARAAGRPVTRSEAIASLTELSWWEPLADTFDVVIESFSSGDWPGSKQQGKSPTVGKGGRSRESRDGREGGPLQGTDLHAALVAAAKNHANLRGIVLASDGDWNLGEPPVHAASQLRAEQVPVFTVAAGSPSRLPDVELARVDLPAFAVVGKPLRIPVGLVSSLPRDDDVTITLTPSTGQTVTLQATIPAMGRVDTVLSWTPQQTGDFELTVDVPPHEDEVHRENNRRVLPIQVRDEAIRVLLVESLPRWEYRYLRNALERDPGVEVTSLLFQPGLSKVGGGHGYVGAFPSTADELARFDVLFLGDVGIEDGELTVEQCRLIKGLIQNQASGLILMPGPGGRQLSLAATELGELFPVVFDAAQGGGWGSRLPAQFELTLAGRRSLLTKLENSEQANSRLWETLPGFHWYAPIVRAKAGSEVLATHRSESNRFGPIPLLVAKTYGTGKVLLMGTDGAWRWRRGVEDKYHYRFWGQVARWMAYQRSMAYDQHMRLFFSPDRPRVDDVVTLNANVMTATGEPLEGGDVMVQAVAPSGKTERIRLAPASDAWGLFSGSFAPWEAGPYELTLVCRETDASLETRLTVEGIQRERIGQPARYDVLDEIATTSGGKRVDLHELRQLFDAIASLPEPEPEVHRVRLWCHPLWVVAIVLLLGIFWSGRKMMGMV
ncbi:MAG: hypothetical protein ACC645_13425 [Pirellulales bacterium]